MKKNKLQRNVLLIDKNSKIVKMISWQEAILKKSRNKIQILNYQNNKPVLVRDNNFDKQSAEKQGFNRRIADWTLLQRDNYQCQYCSKKLDINTLTRDHVIPKAKGGRMTINNVVSACRTCNEKKADRTPEEANMPLKKPLEKLKMFYETQQMKDIYNKYFIQGVAN